MQWLGGGGGVWAVCGRGGGKGLLWSFVGGPGVKLQALGHSPGEHGPKTSLSSQLTLKNIS